MMKYFILTWTILITACQSIPQNNLHKRSDKIDAKEVLLIGTFHYNNPGADLAKTKEFDILSNESQQELETISSKISEYQPSKIFVEWPIEEQKELDSLYNLYLKGKYFENESLSAFYLKNEIFQLAFRVAKEIGLKKIYAVDYTTSFPFNDVMAEVEENKQYELKKKIEETISKFTRDFDKKIEEGASITELTYFLNSQEMRKFSNYFHNNLMLIAGDIADLSGPFLSSEWFKRNLYIWSFIQKQVEESDEKIMVLFGASHAAMFEMFINENDQWEIVELKDVMEE